MWPVGPRTGNAGVGTIPDSGRAAGGHGVRGFGDLEAALMDLLWRRGRPATVREAMPELTWHRELAYTTVMTVMDTLYRKGWLTREPDGAARPAGPPAGPTATARR